MAIQEIIRIGVVLLFLRHGVAAAQVSFSTNGVIAAFETLSTIVFLWATLKIEFSKNADLSWRAIVATSGSMVIPLFLEHGDPASAGRLPGLLLFILGVCVSLLSVVEIWPSFDILPSFRSISTGGPYAVVRHPIYCGYLISMSGYLTIFLSVQNMILVGVLALLLFWRAILEERSLESSDPGYRVYRRRVPYKLFPAIL